MVVAVVDRAGFVLGVFRTQNAPATAVGNFGQVLDANDVAVALARTGAFFSNDQAPLSSRTVRFISGIHFPPGVTNAPPADLYGIENTNRGCTLVNTVAFQSQIPPSLALSGGFGPGVLTGKADVMDSNPLAVNPGGVPIFYQNVVVGGIGVVTSSSDHQRGGIRGVCWIDDAAHWAVGFVWADTGSSWSCFHRRSRASVRNADVRCHLAFPPDRLRARDRISLRLRTARGSRRTVI